MIWYSTAYYERLDVFAAATWCEFYLKMKPYQYFCFIGFKSVRKHIIRYRTRYSLNTSTNPAVANLVILRIGSVLEIGQKFFFICFTIFTKEQNLSN